MTDLVAARLQMALAEWRALRTGDEGWLTLVDSLHPSLVVPDVTLSEGAGAVLLVPALAYLFRVFESAPAENGHA